MSTNLSSERSLVKFLLLLSVLSIPLWVLGAIFDVQILPGFNLYQLPLGMPALATLILIYHEEGKIGVFSLLKRIYDWHNIRSKLWFFPILFIFPSIGVIDYMALRLMGIEIPMPQFSGIILLGYSTVFFMTYGEELGLTGYLTDPLQERFTALKSGLILGSIWAAYHIPGFIISGFYSVHWMLWHGLYTIVGRVLFVWVYNNAGKSLFSMAVLHWTFGIFWILFPQTDNLQKASPYYDPRICAFAVIMYVLIVSFLWGSKTLAQYRFAKSFSRYHES